MHVLRAAAHREMPWKNGGGTTREIAVHPPGASLEDFGWRISMASVTADGQFSMFAGADRTLCILEGNGMELAIGDAPPLLLTPASAPLPFACELPCNAILTSGPVLDLNVMTRRGRFRHAVEVIDVSAVREIAVPFALFCGSGAVKVDRHVQMEAHDCLFPEAQGRVRIEGEGRLYLIDIAPA
jgi:environmental stress-induced protein Ves